MNSAEQFASAVRSGRTTDVRRMLEERPELCSESIDGVSPILAALFARAEETAYLLADHRGSLDACEAAALGSVEALERAMGAGSAEHGANSDARERLSASASHGASAASAGLAQARALGWAPLHLAAYMGRREATAWLLGAGADPAVRSENAEANTPLHAALAGAGDSEVVRLLLEGGADPGSRAALGVTPMHLAASRGNEEAIDALLARGAIPAPMEDGRLPSALAEERGHLALAERLREVERGTETGPSRSVPEADVRGSRS